MAVGKRVRLLLVFMVRLKFGAPQFLHSSPLGQAGGLNRLQNGRRSAAPQSAVGGGQRPLVEQHGYTAESDETRAGNLTNNGDGDLDCVSVLAGESSVRQLGLIDNPGVTEDLETLKNDSIRTTQHARYYLKYVTPI